MSKPSEKLPLCELCDLHSCHDRYHEIHTRTSQSRRSARHVCGYISIISLFIIFVLVWLFAGDVNPSISMYLAQPGKLGGNQTCHWCTVEVPEEQKNWPAVGYDLTESYGTATIKFPSGEYIHIGPIYGDDNYRSAMLKLSLKSSKHQAPPYSWYFDPPGGPFAGAWDKPRRRWRAFRKSRGWPASWEVGTISFVLSSLLESANVIVGARNSSHTATKAVVTSPDLYALYDEDIFDVAEYVGLDATGLTETPWRKIFPESLMSTMRFERQPKYVDAAIMGYGLGLCQDPKNHTACIAEERSMPFRELVVVHLTKRAAEIECKRSGGQARTEQLQYQQHESYYDDTLGLVDEALRDEPWNEARYWGKFRGLVHDCMTMRSQVHWMNVTDVLLVGEKADDERVAREVKREVRSRGHVDDPRVWREGALFAPSRGAAEMAARILWTPEECGVDEPRLGRKVCRRD